MTTIKRRMVNLFQLTAARRRLAVFTNLPLATRAFQLTAARRRLATSAAKITQCWSFQLTAARRRLADKQPIKKQARCFNSQPPEGGWEAQCLAV